jgi:hypothetical protein
MKDRRRHAVIGTVALSLLVIGLSFVAVPSAGTVIDKPTWHAGDWWEYSATNASSPAGGTGTGKTKTIVVGTEDIMAGGVTYATYHTKDWVNVSSGSVTYSIPGETWYRTSDLGVVQVHFAFTAPYRNTTFTVNISITFSFAPPQDRYWPLTPGLNWSSDSTVTLTSVVTLGGFSLTNTTANNLRAQYTVQTMTPVTVPRGTFVANPIQQTQIGVRGYSVSYFSRDVGNLVKAATYDSNGNETSSEALSDYGYRAPSVGAESFLSMASWWWLLVAGYAATLVVVGILLFRPKRPKLSAVTPNPSTATSPASPLSSGQEPPQTGPPPPPR